ncbi:MAG TPA: hypothetical protein VFS08_16280 [Gemmatimonadaceae bacterium]|nr:hypothetical protein [Gemmatimonadaceae bacterium]
MPADSLPYGPRTAALRHFLQRLSAQPTVVWLAAARAHERALSTPAWRSADRALGEAVARAGREAARDALVGPLVQLARRAAAPLADDPGAVERLAEPALAAALALLVADRLDARHVETLYAPFAGAIPPHSLEAPGAPGAPEV